MGDFGVDLAKYVYAARERGTGLAARCRLWLTRPEVHVVACYRLGRHAEAVRGRSRVLGLPLVLAHRLWNRRITRVHHAELSHRAEIGPGLMLMHRYGVIIGPARIGANCVIHQNVTIGRRVAGGDMGLPTFGDRVWIGPGATITGGVTIGDDVVVAAGSVLSKDVPSGSLVMGNPARVALREYDNSEFMTFVLPPEAARRWAARSGADARSGTDERSGADGRS